MPEWGWECADTNAGEGASADSGVFESCRGATSLLAGGGGSSRECGCTSASSSDLPWAPCGCSNPGRSPDVWSSAISSEQRCLWLEKLMNAVQNLQRKMLSRLTLKLQGDQQKFCSQSDPDTTSTLCNAMTDGASEIRRAGNE